MNLEGEVFKEDYQLKKLFDGLELTEKKILEEITLKPEYTEGLLHVLGLCVYTLFEVSRLVETGKKDDARFRLAKYKDTFLINPEKDEFYKRFSKRAVECYLSRIRRGESPTDTNLDSKNLAEYLNNFF